MSLVKVLKGNMSKKGGIGVGVGVGLLMIGEEGIIIGGIGGGKKLVR
ncbi:hypothetical protein [Staphylococcus epidermidis]|nr:hypothetical protein [Staphylococcus epidermidis]